MTDRGKSGRWRALRELPAILRARREIRPRRGAWRYFTRLSFWPKHAVRLAGEARRKAPAKVS